MATLTDPASHSLASRDFQNCCLATGCCTLELHFSEESDRMIVTSIAFGSFFLFFFTLRASVREDDRNNERKTQKTETEEG